MGREAIELRLRLLREIPLVDLGACLVLLGRRRGLLRRRIVGRELLDPLAELI